MLVIVGHTLSEGSSSLEILRNGTYSTQVLLKAKGERKLHIISFRSATTCSNTITNTDSADCLPASTPLGPAMGTQRQPSELHFKSHE